MTEIVKKGAEPSAGGPKVVRREEIAASAEATRILEEARAEARRILDSAQEAHTESVRHGFEEGYTRGVEQWVAAIETARESVRKAIEDSRDQVARLALRVAEKILRQKLETTPEALVPVVDEALRSLQSQPQTRVVVRVHPDDQAVLEARKGRWLSRFPGLESLSVVADEELPAGSCRIESDFGTVDATIETQLRVIERHLLGGEDLR
jgi:type III secretion system HrpE/YscL family protein